MSIKTPSTRQLENLKEAYSERIDKQGKSIGGRIRELYPEPSNENLLEPIISKVVECLPTVSKVGIDSYNFHQCKRKYKITFAIYVDPDEVKDPHAEARNQLYASIEEVKNKKFKELESWYLAALLAATNKIDIPSFDPEYEVSIEEAKV